MPRKLAAAMLTTMRHRGPDGEGMWVYPLDSGREILLGHRRLSIIDLTEAGAQPMADSTGQYVVTYNGEIYNYLEVQAELRALGVQFSSASDTEVLIEAYKYWGRECLRRLNGMFAFAILDLRRGILFCARDRFGEKPFLYSVHAGRFVFASEYRALLRDPALPMDYDEWRLIQAAYNPSTGLDAERQTVFSSIRQLLPAEAMEVDVRTMAMRVWTYWQIEPQESRNVIDEVQVFMEFRDLLRDAVRLRLRSDVPVGSCLSGGLDSSSIVGIVRELLGAGVPYHTFTGRFPGTSADEWEYAEKVVSRADVISHVVEPKVETFLGELPAFIWANELPVGSASQYAQWCVFRLAARESITVLLDGQGADEQLGGYEQYFAYYIEALRERGEFQRLAAEIPKIRARYPMALVSRTRAMQDRVPFRVRHWIATRYGVGTNVLYGLRPEVAAKLVVETQFQKRQGFEALANALVQDSFGRFLTTLLRYGDRNSMAHSREVRLPFCDHRISEFIFALPPWLLMGEVQTKRLLREAMRDVIPGEVRTRWNKQGFRPPQDLWFRSKAMLARTGDVLASRSFRENPYWASGWWDTALTRASAGEGAMGWALWRPFILEEWKTHFLRRIEAERREGIEATPDLQPAFSGRR